MFDKLNTEQSHIGKMKKRLLNKQPLIGINSPKIRFIIFLSYLFIESTLIDNY